MRRRIGYLMLALWLPVAVLAQTVDVILWSDTFDDDDTLANYDVGWFYYGEGDGLVGSLVEQRNGALYLEQGNYTLIGVSVAGTNGVPLLEKDPNGSYTEQTKELLRANDFSTPNHEVTFQVNFQHITSSWCIIAARMIPNSDMMGSDPTESPSYLVFISPLQGIVNLAKTPQVTNAMLDPNGYQWLANPAFFEFQLDVFYWVKYYLYEGIYKVKIWSGEFTDEPEAWLIETVDPDPRVTGEYVYFALLNADPAAKDVMLIDNVTMREVVSAGAGVAAKPATPEGFVLEQNYPNPFNPWTELVYRLDRPCEISLAVYNQTGQRVQQLVRAQQGPGAYRVVWNGSDENRIDQPSGIYYARLTDGEFTRTVKLALVR